MTCLLEEILEGEELATNPDSHEYEFFSEVLF
jgi:hypothetical protein